MADDWESADFDPVIKPKGQDKWEGEDEEEDLKASWEDSEEEGDKEKADEGDEVKATQRKKKKKLADILAEKEAKRKEEIDKKRAEVERIKNSTPEEKLQEKLKQQRLQEESDLQNAKELFGETMSSIDTAVFNSIALETREDYNSFRRAIVDKIKNSENKSHHAMFVEDLCRELCTNMDGDDIKKIGATLSALYNEKLKASKPAKGKKKKGSSLKKDKEGDYEVVYGYQDGLYDDFI